MASSGNEHNANNTNGDADGVELELEVMRKEDFSWHPCKVSLCSTGVGLNVEYLDDISDPDDIILSTEEAVTRLRVRSTPLEGLACSSIQLANRVLAKRNRVNLFFDAEIIEVLRVRHSKRIHCRCAFVVKWVQNGPEGETATVPSPAIMKISTNEIHVHPTIFAFFNVLLTSSCFDVSPLRAFAEGMDYEMDINELEKQIEQISNSADASRLKVTEKVLSQEVDVLGHSLCNLIPASEVHNTYQLPSFQDCTRGSIGQAQPTLSIEMEFKHPPPPSPFSREGFSEVRSPCNPIAACAALASLMSKSSEATEFLSIQKDAKGCIPLPNITNNPTLSFINRSYTLNEEYSLGAEAGTVTFIPKSESIVKELFPSKKLIKEPQTLDSSSEVPKWESKNKKSSQEVTCDGEKKMGLPTRSSSAAKQSPCKNVETPLTNTRTLTRSAIRAIKEKRTVQIHNASKEILYPTFGQNLSVQNTDISPDKETLASVIGNESGLTISDKLMNQTDKKGTCESNVSAIRSSGTGMQALNNSRRLTRSAVKGKSEKSNRESAKVHSASDLEGNITSERKAPEMEKAISTSPVHETCPNLTANGYEKVQLSSSIETAKRPEDNATSNFSCIQGVKRKSSTTSKKQEVRSSPRLRSLPRTRSQTRP